MYQINDKENLIDLKENIKQAYPAVTEGDLKINDGEEIDLLARLQKKNSKTKEEVIGMINKL